ncbi:unnamed protein product [Microthlaspi erraticum]|uniref:Replication protein A 70 kDa DNA-binding subunit B/D first OB fold domain-containing protein n=1 Tax=Microthlaspi erraticum TaxID=1685480 RepID=A0A6D2L2Z2_9BRAS|nr:unnamed protein product [Microthlaspi erraticum]
MSGFQRLSIIKASTLASNLDNSTSSQLPVSSEGKCVRRSFVWDCSESYWVLENHVVQFVDAGEGLSFLFVDAEGTKMHAFVEERDQMIRFKRLLHEGEWKIITNVSVSMVDTEIRLTRSRRKIALMSNTQVIPAENSGALNLLDIVSFGDVWDGSVYDGTSYLRGPIHVEDEEGISKFHYDPKGYDEVYNFAQIFFSAFESSEEGEDEEMEKDEMECCKIGYHKGSSSSKKSDKV